MWSGLMVFSFTLNYVQVVVHTRHVLPPTAVQRPPVTPVPSRFIQTQFGPYRATPVDVHQRVHGFWQGWLYVWPRDYSVVLNEVFSLVTT